MGGTGHQEANGTCGWLGPDKTGRRERVDPLWLDKTAPPALRRRGHEFLRNGLMRRSAVFALYSAALAQHVADGKGWGKPDKD